MIYSFVVVTAFARQYSLGQELVTGSSVEPYTGGMGAKATPGVYTWWCLPMPCVPLGDLACFTYHEGLNAFAFWGRNSELQLVRLNGPQAVVAASSCP